jgi:hypothetical protein
MKIDGILKILLEVLGKWVARIGFETSLHYFRMYEPWTLDLQIWETRALYSVNQCKVSPIYGACQSFLKVLDDSPTFHIHIVNHDHVLLCYLLLAKKLNFNFILIKKIFLLLKKNHASSYSRLSAMKLFIDLHTSTT